MSFYIFKKVIKKTYFLFCFAFILIHGCSEPSKKDKKNFDPFINSDSIVENKKRNEIIKDESQDDSLLIFQKQYEYTEIELNLLNSGLVDIQVADSSIIVDLRYSSTNNFMGSDVYGEWNRAFLQPEAAEKLVIAQHLLKSKFPKWSLVVFDAVRPVSVQQKMWEMLVMPINEKTKYLSNPKNGSLHNYAAAVDISIINENGEELDMGTAFDYFGELAYPTKEKEMLKMGKLSEQQINNRKLLRDVMEKSGFFNIQTEWWHFNSCTRIEAKLRYKIIQ